jgi:hypothetical protein
MVGELAVPNTITPLPPPPTPSFERKHSQSNSYRAKFGHKSERKSHLSKSSKEEEDWYGARH